MRSTLSAVRLGAAEGLPRPLFEAVNQRVAHSADRLTQKEKGWRVEICANHEVHVCCRHRMGVVFLERMLCPRAVTCRTCNCTCSGSFPNLFELNLWAPLFTPSLFVTRKTLSQIFAIDQHQNDWAPLCLYLTKVRIVYDKIFFDYLPCQDTRVFSYCWLDFTLLASTRAKVKFLR